MRASWPFLSFCCWPWPSLCDCFSVFPQIGWVRGLPSMPTQHHSRLLRMHLPFTAGPFTPQSPRSLFHQKNIYQTPLSPERFYPKIQSTFAPWAFYTSNSFHKKPFTSNTFYLLHKKLSIYIRNLLHQSFLYHMPFTQKPLTPGKL